MAALVAKAAVRRVCGYRRDGWVSTTKATTAAIQILSWFVTIHFVFLCVKRDLHILQ